MRSGPVTAMPMPACGINQINYQAVALFGVECGYGKHLLKMAPAVDECVHGAQQGIYGTSAYVCAVSESRVWPSCGSVTGIIIFN